MKSISGYLDITPRDFKELDCHAYRHAVERISRSVLARDIMTREVVFVRPDVPIDEVAEIMGQRGISGVPVTDEEGRVVGVISGKDFLSRIAEAGPKNFMAVIANCLKRRSGSSEKSRGHHELTRPHRSRGRTLFGNSGTDGTTSRQQNTGYGWGRPSCRHHYPERSHQGISKERDMLSDYLTKMKGTTQSPPRVKFREVVWSWVGSFIGIAAVGFLDDYFCSGTEFVLIIGSLGASAVLAFGATRSPLAQPRDFLGGHILSALIGVSAYKLLPAPIWLAGALAVATSIALMHATKILHPPGGATALIAVIGGPEIHNLGYFYALAPIGAGAAIILVIALLVNNIAGTRRYPEFWF